MIAYLWLTLLPVAFSAVAGQGSTDPKVHKAVDSILLIAQNELHQIVNNAVFSLAQADQDLIAEAKKIKAEVEQNKESDDQSDSKSSLDKRFWGYGYGYPYYGYGYGMYGGYGGYGMYGGYGGYGGYGMYGGWPYYGGWGGWYFKVRKDIKQTIESKIIKGFKPVALRIVNNEYTKFLKDNEDEFHLDATQELLTVAWDKYASYQQKNTIISKMISSLEEKLSDNSKKSKQLDAIMKSSLFNVTSVFTSDKMDVPLLELYYPSESADQVDYV